MTAMERDTIQKLRELMEGIKIALMTTVDADGTLQSRPMATQEIEFDGDLWFFTAKDTDKVRDIQANPQVGLSYAAPDKNRFVSVSGAGEVIHDHGKMEQLWRPTYRVWFPDGLDDPDLALIKVTVTRAEYWDAPSNKLVALVGIVNALRGKEPSELGENEQLELRRGINPKPAPAT